MTANEQQKGCQLIKKSEKMPGPNNRQAVPSCNVLKNELTVGQCRQLSSQIMERECKRCSEHLNYMIKGGRSQEKQVTTRARLAKRLSKASPKGAGPGTAWQQQLQIPRGSPRMQQGHAWRESRALKGQTQTHGECEHRTSARTKQSACKKKQPDTTM